ncbi:MAG: hypothetical protein OXG49_04625 [Chloroflexi bacterium]|nr:hypothetical protein [Chloroflexota bacterium]
MSSNRVWLLAKAVVVAAAILALAFTIQTHDHLGILLDSEKGFIRQFALSLARIEQELGIDPKAELFGAEKPRCH